MNLSRILNAIDRAGIWLLIRPAKAVIRWWDRLNDPHQAQHKRRPRRPEFPSAPVFLIPRSNPWDRPMPDGLPRPMTLRAHEREEPTGALAIGGRG